MVAANRGPELATIVINLLIFTFITVALRCYTMGVLMKRLFAEDYLAIITFTFYTAYSVFALLSIHFGLGQHVADVPTSNHPKALLFKYLAQVFYVVVAVQVKFIVGLFLLRICSHKRWQRITIYALFTIVLVFNIFYIFIVILQCKPIKFYWFRYQPDQPVHGKCNNRRLATIPSYASFLLNVVADFTLALLPVSFVWHSKMETRTKCSVVAVLALGSIASFATAARIPYAKQLLSNPDYLFNFTDLAIWSTVEISLGLSASSLATLKPLFRKFKILASTKIATPSQSESALHSRKQNTLSIVENSYSSRAFIENEGRKKQADWNEKGAYLDIEMGNLRESQRSTSTLIPSPPRPLPKIHLAQIFHQSSKQSSAPVGCNYAKEPRQEPASWIRTSPDLFPPGNPVRNSSPLALSL